MQTYSYLFYAVLIGTTLAGCGSTALPYRAPDPDHPSVQLTIASPTLGRRETEHLFRHDVQCQSGDRPRSTLMNLASWYTHAKENGAKIVALPVGRAYFLYERTANGEACALNFSA